MNDSLSEFLLQVQGGLMQDSSQAGIDSLLEGVLLTSNAKENERLVKFWAQLFKRQVKLTSG